MTAKSSRYLEAAVMDWWIQELATAGAEVAGKYSRQLEGAVVNWWIQAPTTERAQIAGKSSMQLKVAVVNQKIQAPTTSGADIKAAVVSRWIHVWEQESRQHRHSRVVNQVNISNQCGDNVAAVRSGSAASDNVEDSCDEIQVGNRRKTGKCW